MKKNTPAHIVSKMTTALMLSCLCASPVFAKEPGTSFSKISKPTQSENSTLGNWVRNFFLFNVDQSVTIIDMKAFPLKNDVLITWNADKLATGTVYYSTENQLSLSSSTSSVAASMYGNYAHSKANIRYLTASTTYYYVIVLKEATGEETISEELHFSTTK